jgi:hypothetical protein
MWHNRDRQSGRSLLSAAHRTGQNRAILPGAAPLNRSSARGHSTANTIGHIPLLNRITHGIRKTTKRGLCLYRYGQFCRFQHGQSGCGRNAIRPILTRIIRRKRPHRPWRSIARQSSGGSGARKLRGDHPISGARTLLLRRRNKRLASGGHRHATVAWNQRGIIRGDMPGIEHGLKSRLRGPFRQLGQSASFTTG